MTALCEANNKEIAEGLREHPKSFRLICDASELVSLGERPSDAEPAAATHSEWSQAAMFDLQRRLDILDKFVLPALVGVAVLLVIPWLWYFLLDRIRELSDAIRGR